MARCQECNYYEEDDDLKFCNHPIYEPSLFGFEIPDEIDCDGFERFYLQEESITDMSGNEAVDRFLFAKGY